MRDNQQGRMVYRLFHFPEYEDNAGWNKVIIALVEANNKEKLYAEDFALTNFIF